MKRIAIIGAGLSGILLGQKLSSKAEVVIFEKAKGVGGRMSTRYAPPFVFDHGAQFFTAETQEFLDFLFPLIKQGVIGEWQGKVMTFEQGKEAIHSVWDKPHFVPIPNMNSLCKLLASSLDIRLSCEVAPLRERVNNCWSLEGLRGEAIGDFDWVISTAPPAQTMSLFAHHLRVDESIKAAHMQSCYALMLGFTRPWEQEWVAAKVCHSPIGWIAVNSSKPGRDKSITSLVVHSTEDWAKKHIDFDLHTIQASLLGAFESITGFDIQEISYISTHRWRYATAQATGQLENYLNVNLNLAATGDWCICSHIEQVWFNAQKSAGLIISKI